MAQSGPTQATKVFFAEIKAGMVVPNGFHADVFGEPIRVTEGEQRSAGSEQQRNCQDYADLSFHYNESSRYCYDNNSFASAYSIPRSSARERRRP